MRVVSYWSDLELWWAVAYTYLLASEAPDEVAAYYDTRDWQKRRSLFMNAAKDRGLPGPIKTDAFDLYTDCEKASRTRNRIVHGNWAWSEHYVNSLFLVQSRNLGNDINRALTAIKKIGTWPQRYPQVSIEFGRGPCEEWKHEDFEEVVSTLISLKYRVSELGNRIAAHSFEVFARKLQQRR